MLVHQRSTCRCWARRRDAADNMATWTLLRKGTPEADQALADAAYGWLLSGIAYNSTIEDEDLYGNHSLDRQRAFQIVCLMVAATIRHSVQLPINTPSTATGRAAAPTIITTVNRSLEGLLGSRAAARMAAVLR